MNGKCEVCELNPRCGLVKYGYHLCNECTSGRLELPLVTWVELRKIRRALEKFQQGEVVE